MGWWGGFVSTFRLLGLFTVTTYNTWVNNVYIYLNMDLWSMEAMESN